MLDLKLLRSEPDRFREALARRGAAEALDELLALDGRRRALLPELEGARAERNSASERIAEAKREGRDAEAEIAAMRELSGRIKEMEADLAKAEDRRDEVAAGLPNLPAPDAPDGLTESDAVVLREVGQPPPSTSRSATTSRSAPPSA